MKIGIDAKWFYNGPVSTRTVLQNLLPELFRLYPGHEWFIFLANNNKRDIFPYRQHNVQLQYVWAGNNMLSNLFVLPRYVRKLKLDVMLYQAFPSAAHQAHSIAFIHDILYKEFPQFFSWKERAYFSFVSRLTKKADRVITTTKYTATELVKSGFVTIAEKIDIVPLAASGLFKPEHNSLEVKKIREKFNLPPSYLLFVGRVNSRKNIKNLIQALALIEDKNIPLLIVGNRDGKGDNPEKIINDLELGNRIIIKSSVGNDELAIIYSLARVFCFPSFAEGFGLPPLEAMASGIPVIVSNTTSLPEVCGDAAVYVDPKNPKDIATAINSLLSSPQLYAEKKTKGLRKASEYSWRNSAEKLMASLIKTVKIDHE